MSMSRVGVFGAAGVLTALLIIAAVSMSGLKLPGFPSHKGMLKVLLTDAPVDLLYLNVTFSSLEIQRDEDGVESWVDVAPPFLSGEPNVTVNLLELVNVTRNIAIVEIDSGNYTKIRLEVEEAIAKRVGAVDWEEVTVPSGRIDIIVHFEVEDGEEIILLIDVTADWIAISHSGNLRPVLKAEATVIAGD